MILQECGVIRPSEELERCGHAKIAADCREIEAAYRFFSYFVITSPEETYLIARRTL